MPRSTTSVLIFFAMLLPSSALAEYRELCSSAPGACTYTGPDAPAFGEDVCRDPTGAITLKGTAACPSGSAPFTVAYGEVLDPQYGIVAAYIPLDDACDHPGVCIEAPAPDDAVAQLLCCEFGDCVPLDSVPCNSANSIAYYCDYGATNQDGTVDCFDGWWLE